MEKTNLKTLTSDELRAMERGLEISLKYVYSRAGKRQTEKLIQKCIDERQRRTDDHTAKYNKKILGELERSKAVNNAT